MLWGQKEEWGFRKTAIMKKSTTTANKKWAGKINRCLIAIFLHSIVYLYRCEYSQFLLLFCSFLNRNDINKMDVAICLLFKIKGQIKKKKNMFKNLMQNRSKNVNCRYWQRRHSWDKIYVIIENITIKTRVYTTYQTSPISSSYFWHFSFHSIWCTHICVVPWSRCNFVCHIWLCDQQQQSTKSKKWKRIRMRGRKNQWPKNNILSPN